MRHVMLAAFAVIFIACPALAQAVDTPVPVIVPPDTVVTIPVGSWLADLQGYIGLGMAAIVGYVFRWVPPRLRGLFMTVQAEQLIAKGLTFAINTVIGGYKEKVWTIDMRNELLKKFTTFVLVHGASSVKEFIGPASVIAEKGFARITPPLDAQGQPQPSPLPAGPPPNFVTIGADAQAAANAKGMQSA